MNAKLFFVLTVWVVTLANALPSKKFPQTVKDEIRAAVDDDFIIAGSLIPETVFTYVYCDEDDVEYQLPVESNGTESLHLFQWPGAIVPVEISQQFNNEEHAKILAAFNEFKKYTCVQFVERVEANHSDYLRIEALSQPNCRSVVGHVADGKQQICLKDNCFLKIGDILNKLMRVLGFPHEQRRPERDEFVTILWKNIKPGYENRFTILNSSHFIGKYDMNSVMHSASGFFTKYGAPTIIQNDGSPLNRMGQRERFSYDDVLKINTIYQCHLPKEKYEKVEKLKEQATEGI